MSAMYRAKVEHSILFVKIMNRYFERQQFFFSGAMSVVLRRFCENEGQENFTCQSERVFCSRYHNKCLHLVSEKFDLASQSNLSLATGLAS